MNSLELDGLIDATVSVLFANSQSIDYSSSNKFQKDVWNAIEQCRKENLVNGSDACDFSLPDLVREKCDSNAQRVQTHWLWNCFRYHQESSETVWGGLCWDLRQSDWCGRQETDSQIVRAPQIVEKMHPSFPKQWLGTVRKANLNFQFSILAECHDQEDPCDSKMLSMKIIKILMMMVMYIGLMEKWGLLMSSYFGGFFSQFILVNQFPNFSCTEICEREGKNYELCFFCRKEVSRYLQQSDFRSPFLWRRERPLSPFSFPD